MSAGNVVISGVGQASVGGAVAGERSMQAFEGFLKSAGRLVGVVLTDIARFAVPIAAVIGMATPGGPAEEAAFLSAIQLVGNAVIAIEQKWSSAEPGSGAQKLADVLLLVEQPVITLLGDAGLAVNAAYVTSLVNGMVALLNAQPKGVLSGLAAKVV